MGRGQHATLPAWLPRNDGAHDAGIRRETVSMRGIDNPTSLIDVGDARGPAGGMQQRVSPIPRGRMETRDGAEGRSREERLQMQARQDASESAMDLQTSPSQLELERQSIGRTRLR